MKKNWVLVAGVLAAVVLAGCGSNQSKKASQAQTSTTSSTKANSSSQAQSSSSSQTSSSSSSAATTASVSSKQTTAGSWDGQKAQQLEAFMQVWAPTLKQAYNKYDGSNQLTTLTGTKYPADLSNVYVDNHKVSIGWNPTGSNKYEYNVVAIYNDNIGAPEQRITYFFALHNGKPVALVNQTTNGQDTATPTKNPDIAKNFASIAAGRGFNFKGHTEQNTQVATVNAEPATTNSDQNYGKYGNTGFYHIPAAMQGTWYSYSNGSLATVTLGDHTVKFSEAGETGTQTFYKADANWMSKHIMNQPSDADKVTKNWIRTSDFVQYGMTWVHMYGWWQTAGAGESYGVSNEVVNGQQQAVLFEAGGAETRIDATYYRTPALAKANKNTKFDNVNYRDGED